ncbi:hypothetical protein ABW19_dt0208528 [Dactylella cylindrospora]|nr:hypothetical protein ABW19_dt0208528 [Dactylella cylindrospora]
MRLNCLCMAFPSKSTGSLPGTAKEGPSTSKSSFFNRIKKGLHKDKTSNNSNNNNRENIPPENNGNYSNSSRNNNINSLEPPSPKPPNARRVTGDAPLSPTTASVPPGALSPPKPQPPPTEDIKPVGRVDSEKRSNLKEIRPTRQEQRALSTDPKRLQRLSGQNFEYRHTSTSLASPRNSALDVGPRGTSASLRSPRATATSIHDPRASFGHGRRDSRASKPIDAYSLSSPGLEPPLSPATDIYSPNDKDWLYEEDEHYQEMIEEELEWRWILNLSMHFRERADREKFFVTYSEAPKIRHRVTVSCDYRNAEPGSLEDQLRSIQSQRDKSARIYEEVRDSLLDIQFYPTITNLKLETKDGRLHVHVNEDVNEIIHYPHINYVRHLHCDMYQESELDFECHLSGFVYKVRAGDRVFIKKEIPGPDTIDEFLYEINALHALRDSKCVIRFGGLVVDERRKHVKGLLIDYAPNGSLVDLVFNERGRLPWKKREHWAKQIVTGLSEIHEEGFVQGDFTMSNMVLDEYNNIKIIDINRRGCPIGWEPPEIKGLIDSQQRIGMFIGVKSDVYQLGMVLWGLVYQVDDPEDAAKPLNMDDAPEEIPEYFKRIVMACLSNSPRDRPSARELLYRFPELERESSPSPIDVVVGDGQIVHVSSASSRGSPTSLRINPKNGVRQPMISDFSPSKMNFVESPTVMTPAVAKAFDTLNGKLNGIGLQFSQEERRNHPEGFDPRPLSSPRAVIPESPATDIVSSPPIKEDGDFQWEGYKVERISDPHSGEEMSRTYRIESLEDARREIANSISSHRGSKRISKGSVSSADIQLPDTASITEKKPQFGRFDSSLTSDYETPSDEFPPGLRR